MIDKEVIKKIVTKIRAENDGTHIDFVVPGYAQRRFTGYYSMRTDLLICKGAIERLLEPQKDRVIMTSLWHTIIALYSKCFTDAIRSRFPKLEADKIYPKDERKLIEKHENLMSLRHSLVAHRGENIHETSFVYLKLDKDLSRHVKVKWIKSHRPSDEELNDYLSIIIFLIKTVDDLIFKTANRLWEHMLSNYTKEELTRMKLAGPTTTKFIKTKSD